MKISLKTFQAYSLETRRLTDKPHPILKTSEYQLSKNENKKDLASVDPEKFKSKNF